MDTGSEYAEVFIDGDEYLHVGLQFWINRSWWSGMTGNRSKEKDVASAMFGGVNNTYEEEVQGPIPFTQAFESMRWFRDETTVCVFIHEPRDTPEFTLRIVNREYWDPSEEEMALAQKGWHQNYG